MIEYLGHGIKRGGGPSTAPNPRPQWPLGNLLFPFLISGLDDWGGLVHNHATLPFVLKLAGLGADEAMRRDPHLAAGLNVSGGKIRHRAVAEALDLEYSPV